MKRFILATVITAFLVSVAFLGQAIVRAQESAPMTEAHIQRIRSNCIDAQSTLTQLHASDALLRVNRGRLYESVSTKLMTPFNSRITLNKYDSTNLVRIATSYEQQLQQFRTDYQQYEEAMSHTLRINCTNQPVAFYDSVADTRSKRQKVHASSLRLATTIQEYKHAFDTFVQRFEESGR